LLLVRSSLSQPMMRTVTSSGKAAEIHDYVL
jgi:hypothetical protein